MTRVVGCAKSFEIRRFASQAITYSNAVAPGNETLAAVPRNFGRPDICVTCASRKAFSRTWLCKLVPFSATDDDGLFATARRLGLSTEAVGYYLAYCDMLKGLVDACRSMSFYNVSTVHERFAPLDPVLTALVLWPRQFPFGLLKGPAYGVLQRELVERTMAFARRPLSAERAAFRLVHFSIPHLPFVFDGQGYNPPFDPMQTSPDHRARRTASVCRSARRRAAQRHARRRHI